MLQLNYPNLFFRVALSHEMKTVYHLRHESYVAADLIRVRKDKEMKDEFDETPYSTTIIAISAQLEGSKDPILLKQLYEDRFKKRYGNLFHKKPH